VAELVHGLGHGCGGEKHSMRIFTGFGAVALFFLTTTFARADYTQRFEFGAGFVTMDNPSQTSFELGAEYEYRMEPMLGVGLAGNYIFSSPGITLIAVPDVFLHPLAGEWLVSAAPLLEFGQSTGTNLGVKVGTRLPISLGSFKVIPEFGIDFINGGRIYIFGLGIQF
jgi:hypothetical protein